MSIYQPAEDSFLMSNFVDKVIKKETPEKILDMGSGSGIQAQTCINAGAIPENIILVDIDKESIKFLKTKFPKSKIIQSDLFEAFEGRLNVKGNLVHLRFDLIIFNPPYLPEDLREPKDSKTVTTGGKKGNEIILRFLKQAKKHLKKDGKILLITSSLSEDINFEKLCYKAKEIGCEKLFFEKLCILEIFNA